jgi:hypothetical protein
MPKPSEVLRSVKLALREPSTVSAFVVMHDGEALSLAAARENWPQICWATITRDGSSGWRAEAVDVNWEDPNLLCAHTGEPIPATYGEPDNV